MKQQKCQILFIQETHFVKEQINKINQNCDADCYHSFGNSNSRGVSILISKQVEYSIIDTHQDSEDIILILNIELDNKNYTLVNIYVPNHVKERNSFFKKLKNMLEKTCLGMLIIGGDLNDTLSFMDKKIVKNKVKSPVFGLKQLIKYFKLLDIWRIKHPNLKQFTWKRKHNNREASRIDFFLMQSEISPIISSRDIRPALIKYTDHLAISIKLLSNSNDSGPRTFKLNNSILENTDYQNLI